MKKFNLLIIGSGYYTIGDKKNFGCILSSTIQWLKNNNINHNNFKLSFLIKDKKNILYKKTLIKKHLLFFKKKINYDFITIGKIKYDYDASIIATPEK